MKMSLSDFGFVNRFLFGRKIFKKKCFWYKNIKKYQKLSKKKTYANISKIITLYANDSVHESVQ